MPWLHNTQNNLRFEIKEIWMPINNWTWMEPEVVCLKDKQN